MQNNTWIKIKTKEELNTCEYRKSLLKGNGFYSQLMNPLIGKYMKTYILPNGDAHIKDSFFLEADEYTLIQKDIGVGIGKMPILGEYITKEEL